MENDIFSLSKENSKTTENTTFYSVINQMDNITFVARTGM